MHSVRQDLAERVSEMRVLVEFTTSSGESIASAGSKAGGGAAVFEGAWTSLESGGLYVVKRVGSELRGPYCFGSDNTLTAHFFNVQIVGNQILCRFRWFWQPVGQGHPVEGCCDFETGGEGDRLDGGWWYLEHQTWRCQVD